jgi:hypothetical protein
LLPWGGLVLRLSKVLVMMLRKGRIYSTVSFCLGMYYKTLRIRYELV